MSRLLSAIISGVIWLIVILWTALVLFIWMISHAESAIQQAALAAQTAALLIAGYVTARALTFLMKDVIVAVDHFKKSSVPPPSASSDDDE